MSELDAEARQRIDLVLATVCPDRARTNQFFHYVWTMICVRRGLLRVVRESRNGADVQLVLQEAVTGRHRLVTRPRGLGPEAESLAVDALAGLLGDVTAVC